MGLPPGSTYYASGGPVPNYRESASACASLLPALMPKLYHKIHTYELASLEHRMCEALRDGNHPDFCALVIKAVREVMEAQDD